MIVLAALIHLPKKIILAFSCILIFGHNLLDTCLLYTSDAADERSSVDLGGRRIIKKKTTNEIHDAQV